MSIHRLGKLLKERREDRGIRLVAKEIGISAATLSRVERGKIPDLFTFRRICTWLKVDPAEILGVSTEDHSLARHSTFAAVHFKADAELSQEAASDIAHLILAAQREAMRK